MVSQARSSSPNSTSTWRCSKRNRLYCDQDICTETPLTSPIIGSPATRRRLNVKSTGGSMPSSPMSTEPTPSKPPATPQGRFVLEVSLPSILGNRKVRTQLPFTSPSPLSVIEPAFDAPTSKTSASFTTAQEYPLPEEPATTPDYQIKWPQSLSRISETLLPRSFSTPPFRLTKSNLSAFNRANIPSVSDSVGHAPTPSISSSAEGRLHRLILRSGIDALQYQASASQLPLAERSVATALAGAQAEANERKVMERVRLMVVLLSVAYVAWCWYWAVEIEFIWKRAREKFGI